MSATTTEGPGMRLKVCLVGEHAVGKTSLIGRFVHDEYDDRYVATLGTKVTKKELVARLPGSSEEMHVVLSIWDIMGNGTVRDLLREAYFRGSQGILAVCDVTRPETLPALLGWRRSIEKVAGRVPAYVLANKIDLVEETRLRAADLEAVSGQWGSPWLFTSAKTGEGVEEAFDGLARLVLKAQLQAGKATA